MAVGTLRTLPVKQDILSLDEIKNRLTPVFEKYRIKRAFLFGSYARGEATAESDIDIRVESGEGNENLRSIFQEVGMWQMLMEYAGKEVDLLTCLPDKKYDRLFYDSVLQDEVLIYEASI